VKTQSELVRKAREKKQITQTDLGQRVGFETGQMISNFERGVNSMPLPALKQVCKILGVSRDKMREAMIKDFEVSLKEKF
jgi:transcriptional regulator with XRE-family HTH domain